MIFTAVMLFWMFIGTLAVGGFSFIMLMILALFTPAMAFLKAKIKKKPLLAVHRPDKKIDYTPATVFYPPLAIHKEYGGFITDPNSVNSAMKGGVSVLPVNSEIGITLDPKILSIIDSLKQNNIQNIEEAEFLANIWIECECGYVGPQKYEIKDIQNEDGNVERKIQLFGCPNFEEEVKHEKPNEEERKPYISGADREKMSAQVQGSSDDTVCTSEDSQL